MSQDDQGKAPDSGDFATRLKAARARQVQPDGPVHRRQDGLALGLRMAVELAAAIAVGAGIGVALDRWFGTMPLMLIIFFVLGAAAGFLNVVRAAREYERRRKAGTGRDAAEGTG